MSIIRHCFALVFFSVSSFTFAEETDVTGGEIENVLNAYFDAISNRNADQLRAVLGDHFVGIDAATLKGKRQARIEIVDTADETSLFPPKGNLDMVGLKVSSTEVKTLASNRTVAFASFVASRPLREKEAERLKGALKFLADLPDDSEHFANAAAQRTWLEKTLTANAFAFPMFAMLGRHGDEWKVICMAFPE
ncbi:hypothetical protein Q31b_49220 [Novipirellula aureliae]|uniref:Lumazine-binding protein n=1 Tax=Novipirellula aureliae TaxID=2527966 RepID=A0A5C6DLX8_9BACT|nr:hypothetical protein [Novipirellula aureliae]TWU36641.1 hypothetical protein Q31b_49220 [Novipirellula aureliae]